MARRERAGVSSSGGRNSSISSSVKPPSSVGAAGSSFVERRRRSSAAVSPRSPQESCGSTITTLEEISDLQQQSALFLPDATAGASDGGNDYDYPEVLLQHRHSGHSFGASGGHDRHDEKEKYSKKIHRRSRTNMGKSCLCCTSSIRWVVLLVLCLQNSLFTVLRRYSQGVLLENYSKYECLLLGEVIKIIFSAWMIQKNFDDPDSESLQKRLLYLVKTSKKMMVLACIYGAMNILSFVSLRNIGAGLFTIFAQAKIFTTALFSTIILNRKYTWTKWRALISLVLGVLLFSEPVWGDSSKLYSSNPNAKPMLGTAAVLIEVSLSGFASIYFEKAIKTDPLQLNIWERNFQLALGSFPVYLAFIAADGGGVSGFGGGWSLLALFVSMLGAAGGLLVALSIKYGDSILKTLATTGAIVLSSFLDYWFLSGPLTPTMMIAGGQVILSICNYTFDTSPPEETNDGNQLTAASSSPKAQGGATELPRTLSGGGDEEAPFLPRSRASSKDGAE